jgi:hypothetical protein
MRRPGFAAPGLLLFTVLLLVGVTGALPAAAFQATPPAGTPAVETPPAQPSPTQAAGQAATPVATTTPAETDVVTLVLWYANAQDADIIRLFPLETSGGLVASPPQGVASVGTADFPAEGVPTVVVGDTTFETYARPDGFVERWTWFDDFEGARPGTLVMQLAGLNGAYANYFGTATFISRDEGGAGGVLVLALRPPAPAATTDAAAEATTEPAADAPATDESAAAEAIQPEATVDPGTEILVEPPVEGEVPPADGEAVGEPAA